jgi:hypothetical protein
MGTHLDATTTHALARRDDFLAEAARARRLALAAPRAPARRRRRGTAAGLARLAGRRPPWRRPAPAAC